MHAADRYHPDADQLALAGTLAQSLERVLPLTRLHQQTEEPSDTFEELGELGLFGIRLAATSGGSGLGHVEEALLGLELGRRLAAPSVFATMGSADVKPGGTDISQRVCAGYVNGRRVIGIGVAAAELILVRQDEGAALYSLQGSQSKPLDQRLWCGELSELQDLSEPLARLSATQVLALRLIDAAALAGIAAATLEMAVAYAGIRQQFGRPIGSFQAIKHHCANMTIAARCARDQVNFAAVALDDRREDASLQVECAFTVAGNAALDNAGKNIQIHGGMGFSDEADPHLFLKRARLHLAIGGGLQAAQQRVADTPMAPAA